MSNTVVFGLLLCHSRGMYSWAEDINGDWVLFWNSTKLARLLPNREPRYAGWYVTWTEDGFTDGGYSAVDCCSLETGQQFLEEWATQIGLPMAA